MASTTDGGTRKLAAIMFTDVKDFSKKMGENEVAAMEVLRIHDDTMREIVAKNHGIVIKVIGDSFMVDFSSAVNAVQCAVEAQERFWEYNKDKSEFESIQIRVGIHLGDVIIVGKDIYGDGVNIAARIQAITEATRICISAEIYNQVRNKLPIKVFSIGQTDLKNIAEPVEVFEILHESIPELSTPSASAQSIPTRKRAEQISKKEHEEAERVEEARRKIDAEEMERRERADVHYQKAVEYLRADDIPKAEEEIKEVYKIVQIHYEAQMLLIQIEERRTQMEEEERKRRVKEEKLRKEEERKQKIQHILDVAIQCVDQERFGDAFTALQEVYTLEPNNEQAKRIEKQVRLAEEAVLERQRQEAAAEEERQREETARLERQKAEELAAAAIQRAAARKEVKQKPKSRLGIIVAVSLAVVVIAAVAVYLLTQGPLAKPSGIAVLPFTVSPSEESLQGNAFPILLSQKIGSTGGVSILSPTSSRTFESGSAAIQNLPTANGVSHVVRGSMTLSGTNVSVKVECVELAEGKTVWGTSLDGDIRDLNSLAAECSSALLKALEMETTASSQTRLSENAEAVTAYLRGLSLLAQPGSDALQQSIGSLRDALSKDSLMLPARAALGTALLRQFKMTGGQDLTLLSDASSLAQMGVSADPRNGQVLASLAESHLLGEQFAVARGELERSLAIQPNLPEALRALAVLALIDGKTDEAADYAAKAQKVDPAWYETPYTLGLVHLFKAQCEDINQRKPEAERASQLFDEAIRLGAPDSLLTFTYRIPTWLDADQEDRIIAACLQQLERADDRAKVSLYYQLGRTYQLRGKYNESLSSFNQGIQLAERVATQNPGDALTRCYYALLLVRSGKNIEIANRQIQQALASAPSAAFVHYFAARMRAIKFNKPDDKAEALRELAKAVALRFELAQVLNPDFLSISNDPQFLATIVRKTR